MISLILVMRRIVKRRKTESLASLSLEVFFVNVAILITLGEQRLQCCHRLWNEREELLKAPPICDNLHFVLTLLTLISDYSCFRSIPCTLVGRYEFKQVLSPPPAYDKKFFHSSE